MIITEMYNLNTKSKQRRETHPNLTCHRNLAKLRQQLAAIFIFHYEDVCLFFHMML